MVRYATALTKYTATPMPNTHPVALFDQWNHTAGKRLPNAPTSPRKLNAKKALRRTMSFRF
jgi:hypothetical protein